MTKISRTHHRTKQGVVKRNPKKKNSSTKLETFAGHWVDKEGKRLSFNLYGHENIDFDVTKDNIMASMQTHLPNLRKLFASAGLRLHKLKWFSPKYYNYGGDSVDLVISIADRKRLIRFIKANHTEIQRMLDANKSYDGYIALTADRVIDVLEKIDKNFDLDPMVVYYILSKYPLDIYEDFFDLLVYDDIEE